MLKLKPTFINEVGSRDATLEPKSLKVTVHQEMPLNLSSLKVLVQKELPLNNSLSIDGSKETHVIDSKHHVAVLANASIEDALITKLHREVRELHTSTQELHVCAHKDSEAANDSAVAAKASEVNALSSKVAAESSKNISVTKAQEASTSASLAKTSEVNAKASETAASTSAVAAKASEVKASASEVNAKASEGKAKTSEVNAKSSETNSEASKNIAVAKAQESSASAASAKVSETNASSSASSASASKNQAASSASASNAAQQQAQNSASEAASSATLATTKASQAQSSAETALDAAERAEIAVTALTGAMLEAGSCDLSTGSYPQPLVDSNENPRSCFWKVVKGGSVSGVEYGVGDSLVYSVELKDYYKIDNTESVTSVNGRKGVVTLTANDVNAYSKEETDTKLDLKFDKVGGSVSGNIQANGGSVTVMSPNSSANNAHFWLKRSNGTNAGLLLWERNSQNIHLRRYSTSSAMESEIVLQNDRIHTNKFYTQDAAQSSLGNSLTRKDWVDGNFVNLAGAQTITGVKTFTEMPALPIGKYLKLGGRDTLYRYPASGSSLDYATYIRGGKNKGDAGSAITFGSNDNLPLAQISNKGSILAEGSVISKAAQSSEGNSLTRRDWVESYFLGKSGGELSGDLILRETNTADTYSKELKFQNTAFTAGIDLAKGGSLRFINRNDNSVPFEMSMADGTFLLNKGNLNLVSGNLNIGSSKLLVAGVNVIGADTTVTRFGDSTYGRTMNLAAKDGVVKVVSAAGDNRVYHTGFKPTWADVGGLGYIKEVEGRYQVGAGKWLKAGGDLAGFLPAIAAKGSSAKSYLGSSEWWFKEAWVNQYRGGSVNVTGAVVGGNASLFKSNDTGNGTMFGADGVSHRALVGVSTTAGEYLFGGNIAGATGFDCYLRVSNTGKLEYTHGSTVNTVYHSGRKPTAADVGAYTRAESDSRFLGINAKAYSAGILEALDSRNVKPNGTSISANVRAIRPFFVSTSNVGTGDSGYVDLLVLDTYSDSSGGKPNALAFNKSNKKIYHLQPDFDGTSWGTAHALYSEANKPTAVDVGAEKQISMGNIGDHVQAVVLLHRISGGASDNYNFRGEVSLIRSNGLYPPLKYRIETNKAYNQTNVSGIAYCLGAETPDNYLCKVVYGGVHYAALRIAHSNAQISNSECKGSWDTGTTTGDPVIIGYYNTNTGAVLNAEIKDSLTKVRDCGIPYTTVRKPTAADVGAQPAHSRLTDYVNSLVRTTGQDLLIRDKRALVGTTSNLIINYANDYTQVDVQSALVVSKKVHGRQGVDAEGVGTGQGLAFYGKTAIGGTNDAWLRLNPHLQFSSGVYCGATGALRHDNEITAGAWVNNNRTSRLKPNFYDSTWGGNGLAGLSVLNQDTTGAHWLLASYYDTNNIRSGIQVLSHSTGEMRLYTDRRSKYVEVHAGNVFAGDPQSTSGNAYTRRDYVDGTFLAKSEVNTSSSWSGIINKIPKISSSGVLEVGQYIDFHVPNSTADFDVRITCSDANALTVQGGHLHAENTTQASSANAYTVKAYVDNKLNGAAGVYSGADKYEQNYPIGHTISAWGVGTQNQQSTAYITTDAYNNYVLGTALYGHHSIGKALAGTWACRGYDHSFGNVAAAHWQRVNAPTREEVKSIENLEYADEAHEMIKMDLVTENGVIPYVASATDSVEEVGKEFHRVALSSRQVIKPYVKLESPELLSEEDKVASLEKEVAELKALVQKLLNK
ncbi:hypothetical protein M2G70_07485 [Vibrio vulnificus]|nr:hypothetical protein [Vibrio vulnificus]